MGNFYRFTIVLIALVMAIPVMAQVQHTGVVTDAESGDPLVGVNVLVKGTTVGAATNIDGEYAFRFTSTDDYTIQFSFVGYRTSERSTVEGDVNDLNIQMEIDPFGLDEIVVTGVASRTAKAVSEVAVSRVNISGLTEKADFSTIEQMLTGKVAGVEIHQTFGVFGAPMKFNIRSGGGISGLAQPTIYIDGIKMESSSYGGVVAMRIAGGSATSFLNTLEPEEIENIEIIKGPAGAASYGTGGSNGVVLITTKRGRLAGEGARNWSLTYKGTLGYHDQIKEYDNQDIRTYKAVNDYLKRGLIQKNNFTLSGGSQQLRIYAGINKSFEKGHIPQSNQDRLNFRANMDFVPNPMFNLKFSLGFQNNELQIPDTGEWGEVQAATVAPYNVEYFNRPTRGYFRSFINRTYINSFIGSTTAEYRPFAGHSNRWLRGLSGRLTLGIDDTNSRGEGVEFPVTDEQVNRSNPGRRDINQQYNRNLTVTGDVRYDYQYFGIDFSSTVGTQMFEDRSKSILGGSREFTINLITTIQAGEDRFALEEETSHFKSAGIFTEHNFSFKDTYYGTFMIRRDYASVLGRQITDIIYPRYSLAVRLDKFEQVPTFFRLLKVRGAYGETGVLPGRKEALPQLWSFGQSAYGLGGYMSEIGNPNLRPERIKEWETGLDTEFGNFAWEFTYYKQFATEAHVGFTNGESTGKLGGGWEQASRKKINVGEIEGVGIESLFQTFFSGPRFGGWYANFTLTNSWMKNKVTSLSGGEPVNESWQFIIEGQPKHTYFTRSGIKAKFSDGTDIMEDRNASNFSQVVPEGEYYGYESDRIFRGKGFPGDIGSFGTTLSAYGFTLYGILDWKGDFNVFNTTYIDKIRASGFSSNPNYYGGDSSKGIPAGGLIWDYDVMVQQLGWGDTGTGVAALTPGTPEYIALAERYARTNPWRDGNSIQSGDFIRLKEISLSYNANKLIPLLGLDTYIRGLSIGVGAQNVHRWNRGTYTGFDPEGQQQGIQGYDGFGVETYYQNSPLPTGRVVYSFIRMGL